MPQTAADGAPELFQARPLTLATWSDLELLFDLPGGSIVRGCWCMYFRTSGKASSPAGAQDKPAPEQRAQVQHAQVQQAHPRGARNKVALCDLVERGVVPGLVGYLDGSPAGWISLGPREDYLKLRRSRIMKPADNTEVWSVVCSYVAKPYRGEGLQHRLLAAAIEYARDNGALVLEAYPVDVAERCRDDSMFFGSRSLYERAGFKEVVRRSPTRVLMRLALRSAG
jgi:GNAT superfamily N-acetyltransferase